MKRKDKFIEYRAIPLPDHISQKEIGECIGNSVETALEYGLRYAEGIAKSATVELWYRHAWNLTEDNEVIDTTWETPGTRYIGREYPIEDVVAQAVKFQVYDYMNRNPYNPPVPEGDLGLGCFTLKEMDFFRSQGVRIPDHDEVMGGKKHGLD